MLKIGDKVIYTPLNSTEEHLATIIQVNSKLGELPVIQFDDMPYPQGQPTMYINFISSLTKITE